MRELAAKLFHDRATDIAAVVVPNGTVIAVITILQVRDIVSIVLGVLSIAYTLWRWRRDVRKGDA